MGRYLNGLLGKVVAELWGRSPRVPNDCRQVIEKLWGGPHDCQKVMGKLWGRPKSYGKVMGKLSEGQAHKNREPGVVLFDNISEQR